MSGWIKMEKDLWTDPRFLRMVRNYSNAHVTQERISDRWAVTLLSGCILQLWSYADTHIREDDTLNLGTDEIDEFIGVEGFSDLMPGDWLEVIDAHCVKLPGFQAHNGTDAKKKALTAKRVARHRIRNVTQEGNKGTTSSNASALPDQTRPDQTRPLQNSLAATPPTRVRLKKVSRETERPDPEWFLDFKLAYPERAGDQGWRKAISASHARMAEGHFPREFIAGAMRYAAFCAATGKTGTEYVKQAATFLGPDKPFLLPWKPPAEPESAMDELRRINGLNGNHDHASSRVFETEPSLAALGPPVGHVRS
jgi:hypothetical protein